MTVFAKDPSSEVDFSVDWSDWLVDGEAITSTAWAVAPVEENGLILGVNVDNGNARGVYTSGGVRGHRYRLSCLIGTSDNRTAERSLSIRVMEL
ncbi:hypothetical protein [Kordiimonas sp. SCSIO 12610]|uniref:phage fiber-tail adaptor protein n=1 Tax=Kordiimonas sp. SCSIO 12610 TaxID=2829597 RepID=UPI00210AD5D1|nr:hypothetical protein [Kordiimonas sp. SCSIO 12610]UTW56183.1 hypothetical protein KFF44_04605 [Kordiimonas sp. SCSIO 12610]